MTKGSLAAQSSSLPSTKSNATISNGSHHSSKTNSFCMDVIWRSTVQVANAQRTYVSYLKKYNLCDVKTGSLDYVWEGGCTGWYADQGGCSRVVSIVWLFGWNFRIYILLREKFWALVSSEIMPSMCINIQHDTEPILASSLIVYHDSSVSIMRNSCRSETAKSSIYITYYLGH